jgi:hypothetical protein
LRRLKKEADPATELLAKFSVSRAGVPFSALP